MKSEAFSGKNIEKTDALVRINRVIGYVVSCGLKQQFNNEPLTAKIMVANLVKCSSDYLHCACHSSKRRDIYIKHADQLINKLNAGLYVSAPNFTMLESYYSYIKREKDFTTNNCQYPGHDIKNNM
jgi:hypothetical protein